MATISDLVPTSGILPEKIGTLFETAAIKLKRSLVGLEAVEAFEKVDFEVRKGVSYSRGANLYTIYAIALAKASWDLMDVSEQEPIAKTFYEYVSERYGTSENSSTIDGYIWVAKAWLLDAVEIPDDQYLYRVREDGTSAVEGDEDADEYEIAPRTVWDVSYSKLLASTGRLNRDKMEEVDWGLLLNPKVSQDVLLHHYRGKKEPKKSDPESITFAIYAGHLCAVQGKKIENLAEIDNFNINNSEVAKEGWSKLCGVLSVETLDQSVVEVSVPTEEDDF